MESVPENVQEESNSCSLKIRLKIPQVKIVTYMILVKEKLTFQKIFFMCNKSLIK